MAIGYRTSTRNLDPTTLREALSYEPETGELTWCVRPDHHFRSPGKASNWNARFAGKRTGTKDPNGYLRVNLGGVPHMAHQLIWAIVHGEFASQIDHINCDPADNRLCNLRACSQAENQHNQGLRKTNKSGFKGVSWMPKQRKWRAAIFVNSKQKHLGLFTDPQEAYSAYCKAALEYHGEFANLG